MERDGGTQEVELVDADADPGVLVTGRTSRVRGWWFVAGAAVLVLVLAGVQWVVDARERAAVERLTAVPGALDPLGDELEVVRRLDEEETRSLSSSIPVADHTWAGIRVGEDGSQAFVATDLHTGETVWSTPLLGPHPGRAAGRGKSSGGGCQPGAGDPPAAATWAVCTVTDGYGTSSAGFVEKTVPATTTRVAVLDTRDGHLIAEWPMEHDASVNVLPGLVLVGLRRDGDIEIVAHDARTGVERWRHDASPAPNTSVPAASWSFVTAGDVVAYADGDALTVLSASGEVVRTDLQGARGETLYTDPGTGLPALPSSSTDGVHLTDTTTLLARDADPARDRELLGRILPLTVDDGSVPGLVLTSRDKLYAWDLETGRPRWDRDLSVGDDALVVRGRVFLCGALSIIALDGRTGDPLWETDAPSCSYAGLATDGQDLLVSSITTGTTGPGGLTGYDFATGEVTRRFGFPDGIVQLGTNQGQLLGYSWTFEEVAVLD